MNLDSVVNWSRRLHWVLELLALCCTAWLSVVLYTRETADDESSLMHQYTQTFAQAAQSGSLVSASLGVKPLNLDAPDESILWRSLQDWLNAEAPVQGNCLIRPTLNEDRHWSLVCTGLKGQPAKATMPENPDWKPLHVLSASASKKPVSAKTARKTTTQPRAEGWFVTQHGNTLHFDPSRNRWTSKPDS